jgi:hypothetical protein
MTIRVVPLRRAYTVGWTTDDDQPAQWRQHGKRSLPCFVNVRIEIIEVQITMGAEIVGRCHDVTNSNREITHVTDMRYPYMTRRHTKVVHLLPLREHSSRNPPSRFPELAYVPDPGPLASKHVRYLHFWQTEPPPALS